MGAQLGDDVVWHTFWNAGDTPCRILEIISPAGFEHFFEDIAAAMSAGISGNPAETADTTALNAKYGIDFDFESVPRLCEQHGLSFPM